MPLRVAEYYGYIHAVNKCPECPFVKRLSDMGEILGWECIYYTSWQEPPKEEDSGKEVFGRGIPVWCPLPTPTYSFIGVDKGVKAGDRTVKMRGLHPENIVWDEPPVFIVEDVEIYSHAMHVMIKPELPNGPWYEYLRKGDSLVAHDEKGSYKLGVLSTPTSATIRITREPRLKKGDRLIALGSGRETEPLKEDKSVKKLRIGEHLPGEEVPPLSCPNLNDGKFHYLVEASIAGELKQYNKCCCGTEFYTDILKKKE